MLKRYMHSRERFFAMRDDDRVVHPFDWGVEFIDPNANGVDPREFFKNYSARTLADSDQFFSSPQISDYSFESRLQAAFSAEERQRTLTWTSGIDTPSPENNTV